MRTNPAMSAAAAPTLALALLVAPAAGQTPETAEAPAALTRFAWPVPATLTVTDTSLKKGRAAKTRYRVAVSRTEDGNLRLRYSDFEMLEFDGRDATTPVMKRMLAPGLAMASAIPDCIVAPTGEFVGCVGLDATVDRVIEFMAKVRGEDEAARIGALMKSPAMEATLQAAVSNDWDSWVGGWIGWEIAAGERVEQDTELPLMGAAIPARLVAEHLGADDEHDACVRLRIRTRASGEEAAAAFAAAIQKFADDAGAPAATKAADVIGDVELDMSVTVVTDPATLRPRSVRTERRTRITSKDGEPPREELERHHFVFDWPADK